MKISLPDAAATRELGKRLASVWQPPAVLLFDGGLGAGKTTCIQALAAALGVVEPVTSPTFSLIEEYPVGSRALVHIDLYRLESWEVPALGLEELWDRSDVLVAIEWAARLPERPATYLHLALSGDAARIAEVTGAGPAGTHLAEKLAALYREDSQKLS